MEERIKSIEEDIVSLTQQQIKTDAVLARVEMLLETLKRQATINDLRSPRKSPAVSPRPESKLK